jgi:hypothetical protein
MATSVAPISFCVTVRYDVGALTVNSPIIQIKFCLTVSKLTTLTLQGMGTIPHLTEWGL